MRILFMGTPDFAVPCLEKMIDNGYNVVAVVTQPDRPKGRKGELAPTPVKEAALRLGLPVLQPEKVRAQEALQELATYEADLLVTAAYGQLLPQRLLDMPRLGCVNVHASLLPRWRGGAPIHRAIIEGDAESGVTIMRMVMALDAGDMISRVVVPIDEADTAESLFQKLSVKGSDLLIETLPQIEAGTITETPQDEALVTFAPNLSRDDERIDWTKDARRLYNQVRGMNSWPVAFTTLDDKVMKIWQAKVIEEDSVPSKFEPGRVVTTTSDAIVIQCGRGTLALMEIQPSGKRRMPASDYLRGVKLAPGTRFGE
ncbi:methionyl-tRNA formyltransferase [Tumebacillus permanentifrigoris]|uniref:Methionyl-tRNA formyltransferase n=1 Tax=Tumebacillus permanentifrigoris TaxID=378543 RepID=A0A316D8K9_9BACL|nr:methionyl-tRNA formyltransferase [Tumebacillus permanentifrigoris]PWK12800.1 methionyl-tRNA formyltransferase [Tumebacillus permanentifrigoris]